MSRTLVALAAIVGVVLMSQPPVSAAPEPSPVPKRWQLDLDVGPLRLTSVDVEGRGPQPYFFMTYRVTNTSGNDVLFAPSFEMATSDGTIARSGRNVPLAVTRTLLDRLDNPFLMDQVSMLGLLLQGEENARDGLVIWPAPTLDVDRLTVYMSGMSGETATIEVPDPKTREPMKVVLRKTLSVQYDVAGELSTGARTALPVSEKRWIMR